MTDDAKVPTLDPATLAALMKLQKLATDVSNAIEAQGISIRELRVAVSGSRATLSGFAVSEDDRNAAAAIAWEHPAIETVNNGILVSGSS